MVDYRHTKTVSFPVLLSVCTCLFLSFFLVCLALSFCLSGSVLCLCLPVFSSVWLCPCLSVPVCLFICLALSLSLYFHLFGSVLVCLCLSGFSSAWHCPFVCPTFRFGSVILSVCPLTWWSLSVHLAICPSDWEEGFMAGLITCKTAARAALPIPTSVGRMFWCPNNDMVSTVWVF